MKKVVFLLVLLVSGFCFSQNINDYQYVIVPKQFDFLKEPNQYNLNTLTKMVFEKHGFKAFFEDELPKNLANNRCRLLYGTLIKHTGFLSTNLVIELKDCQGNILFDSETGRSKIKDFKQAYYDALRKAADSMDSLNYHYTGKEIIVKQDENIQPATPQIKQADIKVTVPGNAAPITDTPVKLYAQPIENGYQLVDTTPKIVLKIYRTSQENSFTAVSEDKNGVVFKKDDGWYFEYYQNGNLISQKLDIRF